MDVWQSIIRSVIWVSGRKDLPSHFTSRRKSIVCPGSSRRWWFSCRCRAISWESLGGHYDLAPQSSLITFSLHGYDESTAPVSTERWTPYGTQDAVFRSPETTNWRNTRASHRNPLYDCRGNVARVTDPDPTFASFYLVNFLWEIYFTFPAA